MQFGLRAQPIVTLAMFSFSIYFKKLQKRLRTRSKAYVTMEKLDEAFINEMKYFL
jgi:hypothetical protein